MLIFHRATFMSPPIHIHCVLRIFPLSLRAFSVTDIMHQASLTASLEEKHTIVCEQFLWPAEWQSPSTAPDCPREAERCPSIESLQLSPYPALPHFELSYFGEDRAACLYILFLSSLQT